MRQKYYHTILYLILGSFFTYFSNGRYSFSLAAWLFPFFFLMVSRNRTHKRIYFLIPILIAMSLQGGFLTFTSRNPTSILYYVPFFAGLIFGSVFLLDRWIYPKIIGFKATLFFPLLYTSIDFINNLVNPFGTTGVLGYSQNEFLSFAQLASITGMWGLTFMITWFGSVASWFIEHMEDKDISFKGLKAFSIVLIIIVSFGSIRLVMPLQKGTVRVAGIHTTDKEYDGKKFWAHLAKKDTLSYEVASRKQMKQLIDATTKEANAGAKIVIWSEVSPTILRNRLDSVTKVLSHLAKELHIYLLANPYAATTDDSKPENKLLFFDPQGKLILTHYKYGGNFIEGSVEGDRHIKMVETPNGKISAVICWDADYPKTVKQVGKLRADILLNPASDWREIDPLHSVVASFRAIENGCSIVRQTRNGLSIMTDPRGKVVSRMDHFVANEWINVGQVPNKRLWTLYPIIGDVFGWLAIIGTLAFICLSLKGTKSNRLT